MQKLCLAIRRSCYKIPDSKIKIIWMNSTVEKFASVGIVQLSKGTVIEEHFLWSEFCIRCTIRKILRKDPFQEMRIVPHNTSYPFYTSTPQHRTIEWDIREKFTSISFISLHYFVSYFQCRIESNVSIDNQCSINWKFIVSDTWELTIETCWILIFIRTRRHFQARQSIGVCDKHQPGDK